MSDDRLPSILTATAMREWEATCFHSGEVAERVVMESAGRAAAAAVTRMYPTGRVVAAVGKGNNGGDAVVALRTLMAGGREVIAVPVGGAQIPPGLTHGWAIPVAEASPEIFRGAAVLIDGILGTGASGAPREPEATAIGWMNEAGVPIVALDGPSGVDLTTGAAAGTAINAAVTVTFGAVKQGLLLHPGRRLAGRILLAEIGMPPMAPAVSNGSLVTDGWARARLPAIPPDANKGSVGLVGVVAGSVGYGGAAILAAMGALRAGCGGVRVLSAPENREAIHAAVPEAVFFDRNADSAMEALERPASVVVGPGIGTDSAALNLLRQILSSFSGAILLDADALTLLSKNPDLLPWDAASRCVLTPHPGELARLLDIEREEVLADRLAAARRAVGRYGCTVLAKGTPSIVVGVDGHAFLTTSGHSGVATGGMGDTLSGVIGAFLAAGLSPTIAAAIGTHFAGVAAEVAGRGRGLLPRDVAEALPAVLLADPPAFPSSEPPFLLDIAPCS